MKVGDIRIVRFKRVGGTPETVELGVEFFRDVVVSSCAGVPGFRGAWFAVDRNNNRTVTLSLWSDVGSLRVARQRLADRVGTDPAAAQVLARLDADTVEFETYDVAAASAP